MKITLSNLFLRLAHFAFAAMIVLIPFRLRTVLVERPLSPIYRDYTDWLLFASDIFLIAMLICWGISRALAPRRLRWGTPLIALPLAGITAIGIVSAIFSMDVALSFYHVVRLLLLGALYLFIVNEIRSLDEIFLPMAIQVMVQAVVALEQFMQQHSAGLRLLGELILDPESKGVSIVWSGQSILLRAYGLTDHPNLLGGCLAFALIIIAGWYVQSTGRGRGIVAIIFALGAVALLLTFSRGAWLAFGSGIAVMLVLFFRARQKAASQDLFILGIAALIWLVPFVWQSADYLGVRFNPAEPSMFTGENRAIVERAALNAAANKLFENHALVGVGLGVFPMALRAADPNFPFDYQPAHIVLLDVAAETGIFGALIYSALMIAPWVALWLNRRRIVFSPALIAVSALLLAITLVGLFDYYTWLLNPGRLWQWLALGLWSVTYSSGGVTHD